MRNKLIQLLKENRDTYFSGHKISEILGISRTAIWKHIKILNQRGYVIETKHKSGYKLVETPENIDHERLREILSENNNISTVEYIETVDSTNSVLKGMKDLVEGSILIADKQTKGKGRLNRPWESSFGKGIWMSVLLKPNVSPTELPVITLMAGFAVATAMENLYNLPVEIKWPNDIIIRGKKVCGILTELSGEMERIESVVVGIGINANQELIDFPSELQDKATSLLIEMGLKIDRELLIDAVLRELFDIYLDKRFDKNFIEHYSKKCLTLNKEVRVITPVETFQGRAERITSTGSLIVITHEGEREVTAGDVSIRAMSGYA